MLKIKKILLLLSISLSFIFVNSPFAKEYKFEKNFLDNGYKEIDKAITEGETHFKRTIALPKEIPPLEFTHNFGRFVNLDGTSNDHIEIKYINQNLPENHYKIDIRPIKHKIPINNTHINQLLKLNDGSDAIYSTKINDFNVLIFEKNEWQYILSLNKNASSKATELLLKIANSIN